MTTRSTIGVLDIDADDIDDAATTNKFTTASDISKLAGIEAGADVTDTTNVTAAGALMDSELTSLSGIKTLTVPDSTTITTFGASLVNDADAATARTTLDVYSEAETDAAIAAASSPFGGLLGTYATWNGSGTVALQQEQNVASISDDGTGLYTLTIDTDYSNAEWAVTFGGEDTLRGNVMFTAKSAGSITVRTSNSSTGGVADLNRVCMIGIGVSS